MENIMEIFERIVRRSTANNFKPKQIIVSKTKYGCKCLYRFETADGARVCVQIKFQRRKK